MSRNWLDVQTESNLLDEVAQRRQRLSLARRSVTPRQASLADGYADAYPWMDPTAVQSFVQAGIAPDEPTVQSIADEAYQAAAENGQMSTPAEDVPDAWYETLWTAATDWAKPVVRTGFTALAAPFEELQALLTSAGVALFDETEAGELGLLSNLGDNLSALGREISDPGDLISDFWNNYTDKAARSGGLLALGDLIQGNYVDLGEGFLPGSYSEETRLREGFTGGIYAERQEAKRRLQLDGHFMSPGRIWARQFTEPGTGQFQFMSGLMDFTQNLAVDPAFYATAGLSKAAAAHKAFKTVGTIPGVRKTVSVPRAVEHFLTNDGRKVVSALTENRDVYAAWKAIGSPDMGGMGMEAAKRLAATTDESATFAALKDILGAVVRERPSPRFVQRTIQGAGRNEFGQLIGHSARAKRADSSRLGFLARTGRLGESLPARVVSGRNLDDAARQLDRAMVNAQLPEGQRAQIISDLAESTNQASFEGVVESTMKAVRGQLEQEWGVSPKRARDLTNIWEDTVDGLRVFDLDDVGNHTDVLAPLRPQVAGQKVDLDPMPAMVAELADDVPLPDPSAIRRVTPIVKQLQGLYDSGLWKGTVDGIRAVQMGAWIPLQLLRNALTIRVLGDSQARIASAGYDSLFTHPADSVAWMMAVDPQSRWGQKLAKLAKQQIDVKGTRTLTGKDWEDLVQHTNALERGSGGWRGLPGEMLTGNYVKAKYGQPGFYEGWSDKLAHMANDPVYKRVAGGLTEGDLRSIGRTESSGSLFDDVSEWFWSGTGQEWRKTLSGMPRREALRTDRQAADAYLKQNFFDQLERVTGGDPDLVDLVSKGRLGKVNVRASGHKTNLSRMLEESYDYAAPGWIGTPQKVRKGGRGHPGEALDHLFEVAFEKVLTNPENYLSKGYTFRQMYFQRAEELITSMPRNLQDQVRKAAISAGMDDAYLARLATEMNKGTGSAISSMQEVEALSASWALSESKRLLYHMTDRNQFFDAAKIVFPFGDIWRNIFVSWGGIARQRPQVLRRFQQGLEGARQPSLLGEAETEPGTGEGFFHPHPSTGEEVFTYPLIGDLTTNLLGLPEDSVEFTGRAGGLNVVAATVLPGFGPAVTIPASHLVPNTPSWDGVRETLMPFGETPSVVDALIPSWAQKMKQVFSEPDPEKNRMFANTVADTMRSLARKADYDYTTRDGQQRLLEDATDAAKSLYAIRGIAQFNLPTGPSFQWNTEDVQGNLLPVKILSDDYRKLLEDYRGDSQAAWSEWVKKYGIDNVLALIGKSRSVVERPVTEKGDAWLRANADLEEAFPQTVGFFAPEPPEGEFDYSAYLRSLETGARETVGPDEQLALANNLLGRMQFEQVKQIAEARPGPESNTWVAQMREQIAEEYPGFDGWVSRAVWEQRPKPEEMIEELRRAVQNPKIASTDAGEGTLLYLSAIEMARQMVSQLPGNVKHYQQAKSARPIRDWLRMVARDIAGKHPDFARVWTGVFKRELNDDDLAG